MEIKNIKSTKSSKSDYFWVYMLLCADGSFYTGMAKDIMARFKRHMSGNGSRYVASRRPLKLIYQEGPFLTRGDALRREFQIKKLKRRDKEKLINV